MKKYLSGIKISARIWLTASIVFGVYWLKGKVVLGEWAYFWRALPAFVRASLGSLPILILMTLSLYFFIVTWFNSHQKLFWFIWICFLSTFPYAVIFCLINYEFNPTRFFQYESLMIFAAIVGLLFASLVIGLYSIRDNRREVEFMMSG